MLLYRFAPGPKRLIQVARPLWGDKPDTLGLNILDAVLRHVRLEAVLPRLSAAEELSALKCPVLVAAATHDVLFPAGRVFKNARRLMPSLHRTVELEGMHVPGSADLHRLRSCVREFCEN
jgi:pimeloyl-ACP methyl ester carboxylesterase